MADYSTIPVGAMTTFARAEILQGLAKDNPAALAAALPGAARRLVDRGVDPQTAAHVLSAVIEPFILDLLVLPGAEAAGCQWWIEQLGLGGE